MAKRDTERYFKGCVFLLSLQTSRLCIFGPDGMRPPRRHTVFVILSVVCILSFIALHDSEQPQANLPFIGPRRNTFKPAFDWSNRTEHYPVASYQPVPRPSRKLPKVQHSFPRRQRLDREARARQSVVKLAFQRCWQAYRTKAWLADELQPISQLPKDHFGGWAATLVDTLDTLWIMGLKEEFEEAVAATTRIDFSVTGHRTISVFETTIRYLGGLIAAYDLSGDARLLRKSIEVAEMLYGAFDTPNRLPVSHWNMNGVAAGIPQQLEWQASLADIASLTIEFTRMSQLTGNAKWYDAVARITDLMEAQQHLTNVPGLWPSTINPNDTDFHTGFSFTMGAYCDSAYEYILKMNALLAGSQQYRTLYLKAADAIIENLLFRPMVPDEADLLMAGHLQAFTPESAQLVPAGEHLACFAGGMFALGGRWFKNQTHVEIGRKLTDGCIWTYNHSPLGIMPEDFTMVACSDRTHCPWNHTAWRKEVAAQSRYVEDGDVDKMIESQRLSPGFSSITNRHYILRPEAIESVFILYRITGDEYYREAAWKMFHDIQNHTTTELANAALSDVTDTSAPRLDEMESFWLAETLKYFYLIFSDPSLISLDEYVFNTEAHPMRIPKYKHWL